MKAEAGNNALELISFHTEPTLRGDSPRQKKKASPGNGAVDLDRIILHYV
jgi:hypothetical protein